MKTILATVYIDSSDPEAEPEVEFSAAFYGASVKDQFGALRGIAEQISDATDDAAVDMVEQFETRIAELEPTPDSIVAQAL